MNARDEASGIYCGDLVGAVPVESVSRKRYRFVLIDDYSGTVLEAPGSLESRAFKAPLRVGARPPQRGSRHLRK